MPRARRQNNVQVWQQGNEFVQRPPGFHACLRTSRTAQVFLNQSGLGCNCKDGTELVASSKLNRGVKKIRFSCRSGIRKDHERPKLLRTDAA